jgi:hypothetical protein
VLVIIGDYKYEGLDTDEMKFVQCFKFNTKDSNKITAWDSRKITEQCLGKDIEGSGPDVNWCKSYYLVELRKSRKIGSKISSF